MQGGNGAGKTTLLRVLAGLLRADAGVIEIEGVAADAASRARHIAYLGHLPGLKADLSALHNLHYLCACMAIAARKPRKRHWESPVWPGMKMPRCARYQRARKRLGLARLWLSPAPLWLLDEPHANLDLDGIHLVNQMVQAHLRAGGVALITTHGA